jgi:hypothetical protein
MTPLSEKANAAKEEKAKTFHLATSRIACREGFEAGYHTAYEELRDELDKLKRENEELRGYSFDSGWKSFSDDEE